MPTKHIPHQTHVVVWGLPSSGKDFLTELLKQRFPDAFSFGMGEEFRSIPTDGPSPFGEGVDRFVRERMPEGDLAPLDVYIPVFSAAWQRQVEEIRRAKLSIFNGVVRTLPQWYHFRAQLCADAEATHRVIVLCLDRPKELCVELWKEAQAKQARAARPDDARGLTTLERRFEIALNEWQPVQSHLENGSTADLVRVVVPGRRMEDGFDRIVRELELNEPRPSIRGLTPSPGHEFLRAAEGPLPVERLRKVVQLAA